MELRNVVTFVRIAELQNFSRAAEQLGYSQSAVTMQMKQLEEELGVLLFERIGKQIRLTQAGTAFLPRALEVLDAVRRAGQVGQGADEITGTLRIGVSESLLSQILPPVLMAFHRQCPKVEVSTHTGLVEELFDMVRRNEIDVLYFLDKKTNFPEWVKVTERMEQAVFVASAASPLAGRRQIGTEELLGQPLLLSERGISYRYLMEQQLAEEGYELHPFLETGNTDLIVRMLLEDCGVSFLPEFVIREEVRAGRLAILDTRTPPVQMWSQVVYHRHKFLTPQMERFLEAMEALYKDGADGAD